MGIFGRIKNIAVADVNDYLDGLENPVSMVKQYIREVEEAAGEAQQAYANQLVAERQVEGLIEGAQKTVAKRSRQAELAVDQGEDGIAALALQEKLVQQQRLQTYLDQKELLAGQTAVLNEELKKLKDLHAVLQDKLLFLTSRANAAQAIRRSNAALRSFDTNRIAGGLSRIEAGIWRSEAQAAASRHVQGVFSGGTPANAGLQADVQEELKKLKASRS
ncbi:MULTISPECIES: PspA/IM30 family protein [Paenibacillus]|uniref:PspA/IM30 family protein n=1 Tax=Paenibacillus TaxID=44249 RepID=UPI0022B893C3|nr:PspA/IM30 family protein [Paenibacillus caseinilyticus]MCZ8523425.1 PspA/IM30 family protein [Paenibacillus caseinilyticus]